MPTKKTTKTAAKKTSSKKTAAKKPAAKKTVKKSMASKVTKKPAVKKTTNKKTAAKKPATRKKTATKKPAKNLVYAADEQSFWTTDGEILNSLIALADAFDRMEKDVYQFHAGGEQNDFVIWVDTVLCDADCAGALEKAKTPKSAKTTVVRHLKLYAI